MQYVPRERRERENKFKLLKNQRYLTTPTYI